MGWPMYICCNEFRCVSLHNNTIIFYLKKGIPTTPFLPNTFFTWGNHMENYAIQQVLVNEHTQNKQYDRICVLQGRPRNGQGL